MKELVKGYAVIRTPYLIEEGKEILYAVFSNGNIKMCVKDFSSLFIEKGVEWYDVDCLPENVEFIGHYPFK